MPTEFTGEQKLRIVLESIIRGIPREEQCKKYGIEEDQFQTWHDHLIQNGGKIYEMGSSGASRKPRSKKVRFIPWYFKLLLLVSLLTNFGGLIVWGVWRMASPQGGEPVLVALDDIGIPEDDDFAKSPEQELSPVAMQEKLDLENLIEQVDEMGKLNDSEIFNSLPDTTETSSTLKLKEMLAPSLQLSEKASLVDLASEIEFLDQTYEGKHVVYVMDAGTYQLDGSEGPDRLDRMKVALLESLTKLSENSYFNLVLFWNLREAHALGKTILRASEENKRFATEWITSLGRTPAGLKEGRNQFYPKELLYAKPLPGVVGPWYGLATAMSYDPDLVFFLVGNTPRFSPDEVSKNDYNGLGLKLTNAPSNAPSTIDDGLKTMIRKTSGKWLVALQSDRNLPSNEDDIEAMAMTRLGLDDWAGMQNSIRVEVPWDKAFDNFLAGLELGMEKIPQVHVFKTLSEPVVWPTALQKSIAEFCESSRGSLNDFP